MYSHILRRANMTPRHTLIITRRGNVRPNNPPTSPPRCPATGNSKPPLPSSTEQWVLDTKSTTGSFTSIDGTYNSTAYPPSTATEESPRIWSRSKANQSSTPRQNSIRSASSKGEEVKTSAPGIFRLSVTDLNYALSRISRWKSAGFDLPAIDFSRDDVYWQIHCISTQFGYLDAASPANEVITQAKQADHQVRSRSAISSHHTAAASDRGMTRAIFDKWRLTTRERIQSRQGRHPRQCQRKPSRSPTPDAAEFEAREYQQRQTMRKMQMVLNGEASGLEVLDSEDQHQASSPMNTLRALQIVKNTMEYLQERVSRREHQGEPSITPEPRTPSPAAHDNAISRQSPLPITTSSWSVSPAADDNKISPFDDKIQMTTGMGKTKEGCPPDLNDNDGNESESTIYYNHWGEPMPSTRKSFAPYLQNRDPNRPLPVDSSGSSDFTSLSGSWGTTNGTWRSTTEVLENIPKVEPNSTLSRLLANKINPRENLSGFLAAILGNAMPRGDANGNGNGNNDNDDNDAASVSSTSSTSSISSIISKVSSIAGSIKRYIFG